MVATAYRELSLDFLELATAYMEGRPWLIESDCWVQILPRVCPGGRTTELLAAHGQRGGSKQKIGAPQAAEGVHADKHSLHVSLQAAESTERPGR